MTVSSRGLLNGLLAMLLLACGGSDSPNDPASGAVAPGDGEDKSSALVGTWETHGEDPDLGSVDVFLDLRSSGQLRITVSPPAGGSLSFTGTWTLVQQVLHLRGAYFGPVGETRANCQLSGDTLLVLQDTTGAVQRWRRRE